MLKKGLMVCLNWSGFGVVCDHGCHLVLKDGYSSEILGHEGAHP